MEEKEEDVVIQSWSKLYRSLLHTHACQMLDCFYQMKYQVLEEKTIKYDRDFDNVYDELHFSGVNKGLKESGTFLWTTK